MCGNIVTPIYQLFQSIRSPSDLRLTVRLYIHSQYLHLWIDNIQKGIYVNNVSNASGEWFKAMVHSLYHVILALESKPLSDLASHSPWDVYSYVAKPPSVTMDAVCLLEY